MTKKLRLHRTAFTLIEMLITIAIGSSIMVTSVSLLHKSFQLHKTVNERVQREQLLDRFIQQFRSDLYAATDVEILPTSRVLLEFADQDEVVYFAQGSQLVRESTRQGRQRQSVELGQSMTASFDLTDDGQRVVLVVRHQAEPSIKLERRRIEVAIGRFSASSSLTHNTLAEEPK